MSERLPTGGFMMLDRQLMSDPDVRAIRRERQYLVGCCRQLTPGGGTFRSFTREVPCGMLFGSSPIPYTPELPNSKHSDCNWAIC